MGKITSVAENFLYYFLKYSNSSTYGIHKHIESDYKNENKSINYKNVYQRVQILLENDLIKEITRPNGETNKHGAILFKISSFGIFYLLLNNLHRYNKDMILKHIENPFFKFYLFPYFEVDTIKQITDDKVVNLIFDYLNKCALEMDKFLDFLKDIKEDGGTFSSVDFTLSIFDRNPAADDQNKKTTEPSLVEVIRKVFESLCPKSKKKTRIEIIKENKKARLTDGVNELFFEILEDEQKNKQKAELTINKKKIIKYLISYDFVRNEYQISHLHSMTVKQFLKKYEVFEFFEKGPNVNHNIYDFYKSPMGTGLSNHSYPNSDAL
ncbi:MAG: hypothetical protein L0H55_15430, partial [Candidatus Nitrosocosmicus sp.]|nr:hypothetical protein [Candidatus Nitrosocosmicus sp.]